jgi:hypothetical protein
MLNNSCSVVLSFQEANNSELIKEGAVDIIAKK